MTSDPKYWEKLSLADLYTVRNGLHPGAPEYVNIERAIQAKLDDKEIKKREEEWHRHLANAVRSTAYAYWAAILTSDSIIVAVFARSMSTLVQKDFLAQLLILLSLGSALTVIVLFRDALRRQRLLGARLNQDLSDDERKTDIEEAKQYQRNTENYEQICAGLFVVQILIIALKVIS